MSFIVCFLLWPATAQVLRREPFAVRESTQLLVIVTPEWNAPFGALQRYARSSPNGAWKPVGHPIAVVVGENGLGWYDGSAAASPQSARDPDDPVKKEGDLRSPAGIFRLGPTFGYASQEPAGWRMPYLELTPSTECVNDPKSKYYNQLLDRATVSPDWKSSEQMRRADGQFQWGLVIGENADPAPPGDGSCAFLSIWEGPGKPTSGCTATAEEQVKNVLGWLDPSQNPLLVQLPASRYDALQKTWDLPPLP